MHATFIGYSILGPILWSITTCNTQTDPTTNPIDLTPCCPHNAQERAFCIGRAPDDSLGVVPSGA